jgi:hypothetical protein
MDENNKSNALYYCTKFRIINIFDEYGDIVDNILDGSTLIEDVVYFAENKNVIIETLHNCEY